MCLHSEYLQDSVNQYFPNDHLMILQHYSCLRNLFRVQERPMEFNVTEHAKLTEIVLDSLLQLIFRKPSLVEFRHHIKEEKSTNI